MCLWDTKKKKGFGRCWLINKYFKWPQFGGSVLRIPFVFGSVRAFRREDTSGHFLIFLKKSAAVETYVNGSFLIFLFSRSQKLSKISEGS